MAQKTDLNVAPYYDDFDSTDNFHKVLFRPGFAVQARELTQLQSILQNQIEKISAQNRQWLSQAADRHLERIRKKQLNARQNYRQKSWARREAKWKREGRKREKERRNSEDDLQISEDTPLP